MTSIITIKVRVNSDDFSPIEPLPIKILKNLFPQIALLFSRNVFDGNDDLSTFKEKLYDKLSDYNEKHLEGIMSSHSISDIVVWAARAQIIGMNNIPSAAEDGTITLSVKMRG